MVWSRVKLFAVIAGVVVTGAGVGYLVITSTAPADPCAGVAVGSTLIGSFFVKPTAQSASIFSAAKTSPMSTSLRPASAPGVIQVVAAENFWGSLVSQLGGNRTSVLSVVTDPNADPHEYEANVSDATAIANAQYIIVNGVGYDDWALQLIASDGQANQLVLNVGALNGVSLGAGVVAGNPHMWYNPLYVNTTIAAMYANLVSLQPSSAGYFQANYAGLNASLATVYARATEIKHQFAGTIVAATEDIFVYLANFTSLNLISPPEFMQAVSEGNDPPAQSVVTLQCQLESGKVHVLVYNGQTVTPTTTMMKTIATQYNVPLVGVSETIQPPGATFEVWFEGELLVLQNMLNGSAPGR